MKSVEIIPSALNGKIKSPPSKSLSHRAIIASALCYGESKIENIVLSQDILHTCRGVEALGAKIEDQEQAMDDIKTLNIRGSRPLTGIREVIECGESASTLRFLIPIAALIKNTVTFKGSKRLGERPLDPYYKIFTEQNLSFSNSNGKLPLHIHGTLQAGTFQVLGGISSQFISGLLFALPLLEGDSCIQITSPLESKTYVDLTLEILKRFGIEIENKQYREIYIVGNQRYQPTTYRVEGDYSQAAFWMAAGILGGQISISKLNPHSLQGDQIMLDLIKRMAGNITSDQETVTSSSSKTRGIAIDARQCPDLVPILAVLGALSKGTTTINHASRLRIKESNRLQAMAEGLNTLGARVIEKQDGLRIEGVQTLMGGTVDSYNDHRIAMALAIASIKCRHPVIIKNSHAVEKSYPNFWQDFSKLGGKINERSMG